MVLMGFDPERYVSSKYEIEKDNYKEYLKQIGDYTDDEIAEVEKIINEIK
jgi:hypothetical protein